ncbi:hypothetical protein D6T91_19400 [Salmonella enterica subsp. houtenae]|nr:hypothetical protein [Salmonella enterica subsp. houtenae]
MVGIIFASSFKPGLMPGFFISILIDLSRLLNINLIICVYRNKDNLNFFRLRCSLFTQALKL